MVQAGTGVAEALRVSAVPSLQESCWGSDGLCLASPRGERSAPIKLESEKWVCGVSAALGRAGRRLSSPPRPSPAPLPLAPLCGLGWRCARGGACRAEPTGTFSLSPSGKGHWWKLDTDPEASLDSLGQAAGTEGPRPRAEPTRAAGLGATLRRSGSLRVGDPQPGGPGPI